MDDINELKSLELKALDAMNSLGLRLTWTTTSHMLKALDAMKSYGF